MKKEELFKHMSELDNDLIAEAGDEGVEVEPIHIVKGKGHFGVKTAAVTAACCVLAAGTAVVVVGSPLGGVTTGSVNSTTDAEITVSASQVLDSNEDKAGNDKINAAYPEEAKYRYTGDYSEFKGFSNVICMEFANYYDNYWDLLNDCDLAVVGEFIDEPCQDIDPERPYPGEPRDPFGDYGYSFNCFRVDKVLTPDSSVKEGDELVIYQSYAIAGDSIVSHSKLTPMLKGDRWVYFLTYSESSGIYSPYNDYMGRYPDPGYCRVFDHDPELRESANRFLPAMTNKYGLTDANDFNENIYRTLEEILCPSEHTNSAQCVYDCDNLEMYNETSFAMAEFGDDIEFILKNGSVYVNFLSAADSAQHGYGLITETGDFTLKKAYLADINGDGKREICYQVHDNSGALGDHIFIFDCADQKVYGVTGRSGESEYYLGDIDGELVAYNTECTSDGSRGEVISHEKLSLDMNDCSLHLDCVGHSEYCLHDSSYCERQEGECAYRNGEHDENPNTDDRHSEYCLQDADYCAQQGGDCPYRQGEHHEETNAAQHHGHSEYCLQDSDYCAQQGGDCPYRQGEHHEESVAQHHGHSEYCLQDADYCAQQGGDCPYRQGEHHEESNEHHGHSEYCLQDAAYCAQQGGNCPYRQDGSHHGESHHGDSHH